MKKNLREIAKAALKQSNPKKTNNKLKQRGYKVHDEDGYFPDVHGADKVEKVVSPYDEYAVNGGYVTRNPKAAGYRGASPYALRHVGESDIRDSDNTAARRKRNQRKKATNPIIPQKDKYEAAIYNRAAYADSKKDSERIAKNVYFKEVARDGDSVMFDGFRKKTGGMGGKTMTSPEFLRDESQNRDNKATLKANVAKAKKANKTKTKKY